jgi:hypothetical protein
MTILELVDDLYGAFADRIAPLSASARDLPRALRLAPAPVPWSQVFPHEVTLGAPVLIGEVLPGVAQGLTRDAMLAHVLAVVDSYGTARIEDERIEASPAVFAVLGRARRERDRAMERLFSRTDLADTDFRAADAMTIRAVRRERAMLQSSYPVDLDLYERTLLDKTCSGVVASVALARIGGLGARRCRAVRATLESVALALHAHDDVVDWEADLERGGTWTMCLMRGTSAPPKSGKHARGGAGARTEVRGSGILEQMLVRARVHMRAAKRRAGALGALRLASWAAAQEARLESLVAAEADGAGLRGVDRRRADDDAWGHGHRRRVGDAWGAEMRLTTRGGPR